MRKPDNSRPGAGGKGRSFKKDSGKTDRKAGGSRPYSDKPKRDDGGFAGRKERPSDGEKKPRRSFGDSDSPRKPYRASGDDKPRRSFGGGEDRPYKKPADRDDKPRRSSSSDDRPARKPYPRSDDDKGFSSRPRRASGDASDDKPRRRFSDTEDKPHRSSAGSFDDKPRRRSPGAEDRPRKRAGSDTEKPRRSRDAQGEGKTFGKFAGARGERSGAGRSKSDFADKPRKSYGDADERKGFKKGKNVDDGVKRVKYDDFEDGKVFSARRTDKKGKGKPVKKAGPPKKQLDDDGMIRLNKYLSNAGVASRREADTLIQSGVVKVNGVVVDQLGTKINPNDKVTYGDAAVRSERKVYLLLNKPKDYITTTDDPQERKTVMELVAKACKERIYPVGRLDRNTTGLLLFTNDGDLTTKLMHPKYQIKKIYHVSLNKGLKPEDFKGITEGIELEDGIIKADDLAFVGEGKKEIGIEIHSGRNRIVRRIFEHLGYEVLKLDRVAFAGLTKKDLPRGKHRFLTAKEIAFLQMVG